MKHGRTPIQAIRAKCLDCSYGEPKEVRLCPVKNCPLWPYRMGRRPAAQQDEKADKQIGTRTTA